MSLLKKFKPFIISFLPIVLVYLISQMFPMQTEWYNNLVKPNFQPPNWIFGVVWPVLYILIGLAGGLIVKAKDWTSFLLYLLNLTLNLLWSFLFFKLHLIFLALVEIVILWLTIIIMAYYFRETSRLASWLIIPYLLWVSFAVILNLAIYILN